MNLRNGGTGFARLGFVSVGLLTGALALAGCKQKSQDSPEATAIPAPAVTLSPVGIGTAIGAAADTAAPAPVAGPTRKVGDRISVRWKGSCYASRILSVAKPGVYFITYEGYAHSWDETIGESRICK
jgi:hypothetical protein